MNEGKCLFFKFVREMSQAECWANQCAGLTGGVMLEYFIIQMHVIGCSLVGLYQTGLVRR